METGSLVSTQPQYIRGMQSPRRAPSGEYQSCLIAKMSGSSLTIGITVVVSGGPARLIKHSCLVLFVRDHHGHHVSRSRSRPSHPRPPSRIERETRPGTYRVIHIPTGHSRSLHPRPPPCIERGTRLRTHQGTRDHSPPQVEGKRASIDSSR